MKDIAIILLAYRGVRLHRVLSSFLLQKDKNFRVYVCDDASPDDIAGTVLEFEDRLDLVYYRFAEHLGIAQASAHYERCLEKTGGESLVCFFSDDNELTPDAIRRIRRAARRYPEIPVFHLNTAYIDGTSGRTGEGKRFCRKMTAQNTFKRIFKAGAPAPMSSFFFRRAALEGAMFQIKEVSRSPLTLVFAALGAQGSLMTPWRARLLKRPHSLDEKFNPDSMEKVQQMLSFFGWTEYFFENYPLNPRERVELFASYAARLYPARSESEVAAQFLRFRVFERDFGKLRGKRILHRSLSK